METLYKKDIEIKFESKWAKFENLTNTDLLNFKLLDIMKYNTIIRENNSKEYTGITHNSCIDIDDQNRFTKNPTKYIYSPYSFSESIIDENVNENNIFLGVHNLIGVESTDKISNNILEANKFVDYIHATVTIYTIFSLPKLINWCINNEIELKFFYVGQPFLNPVSLPKDIKIKIFNLFKNLDNISEKLQKEIRDALLKPLLHNREDYKKLNGEFKRYTKNLDKIRDQSFEIIVPELKYWYLSIKE